MMKNKMLFRQMLSSMIAVFLVVMLVFSCSFGVIAADSVSDLQQKIAAAKEKAADLEEKAEAAARKQFDKDFEKLKNRRRDWRTADNLSLDDEAVRRVGLAMEEEKAALEYAKQTAENTKDLATVLEQLVEMKEN